MNNLKNLKEIFYKLFSVKKRNNVLTCGPVFPLFSMGMLKIVLFWSVVEFYLHFMDSLDPAIFQDMLIIDAFCGIVKETSTRGGYPDRIVALLLEQCESLKLPYETQLQMITELSERLTIHRKTIYNAEQKVALTHVLELLEIKKANIVMQIESKKEGAEVIKNGIVILLLGSRVKEKEKKNEK